MNSDLIFTLGNYTIYTVDSDTGEAREMKRSDQQKFSGRIFHGKSTYCGKRRHRNSVSKIPNIRLFVKPGDFIADGGFDLGKLPREKEKTALKFKRLYLKWVDCVVIASRK
ncbi:MAG TPA: hypothetical protein VMD74_01190 [Candidatus Methylomirabilis sp.]|nr:hypothetical protein [Candidatus Methylomirabilis sp.]